MKYFTKDLWEEMNSEADEVRMSAMNKWKKNIQKYNEHYNKINKYIPKYIQKILIDNKEFHDYLIEDLKMYKNKNSRYKNNLKITIYQMRNNLTKYEITYKNIEKIELMFIGDNGSLIRDSQCIDAWGFSELDITDDGSVKHNVLFSSGSELLIICDKLIIKKYQETKQI